MLPKTALFGLIMISVFIANGAGHCVADELPGLYHILRIEEFDGQPNCFKVMTSKINDTTHVGFRSWDPPNGCGISNLFVRVILSDGSFESFRVNADGSRGPRICQVTAKNIRKIGNILKLTRNWKCVHGDGIDIQVSCQSRKPACDLSKKDLQDLETLCPANHFLPIVCDSDQCDP